MSWDHGEAVALESIVRDVYKCNRGDMGGFINADHFAKQPFDAAIIALSQLWRKADYDEIEAFLFTWDERFREDADADIKEFVKELRNLVKKYNQ